VKDQSLQSGVDVVRRLQSVREIGNAWPCW
jgi:hypothetical protein